MNRVIKFRAWINRRSEFAKRVDLYSDGSWVFYYIGWDDALKQVVEIVEIPSHNDILEQFTGLQDKNGVDICEGDIVRTKRTDNCFGGEIEIETEIIGPPEYTQLGDKDKGAPNGSYPVVWHEVIGNIHENPELLKDS